MLSAQYPNHMKIVSVEKKTLQDNTPSILLGHFLVLYYPLAFDTQTWFIVYPFDEQFRFGDITQYFSFLYLYRIIFI